MAVDATSVYYGVYGAEPGEPAVERVSRSDGHVDVVAVQNPEASYGNSGQITIDDEYVYVTSSSRLARARKEGGPVEVLAREEKLIIMEIAVDASAVFYDTCDAASSHGSVVRLSKSAAP